jgi:hypothetical protein
MLARRATPDVYKDRRKAVTVQYQLLSLRSWDVLAARLALLPCSSRQAPRQAFGITRCLFGWSSWLIEQSRATVAAYRSKRLLSPRATGPAPIPIEQRASRTRPLSPLLIRPSSSSLTAPAASKALSTHLHCFPSAHRPLQLDSRRRPTSAWSRRVRKLHDGPWSILMLRVAFECDSMSCSWFGGACWMR